jgi:hypothetical protein
LYRYTTAVQVPPNLTPEPDDVADGGGDNADPASAREGWRRLLRAGVSDWGGVSPGVGLYKLNPDPQLERLLVSTLEPIT